MIERAHMTGLVLAGGRATRMGGTDKGLQLLRGVPLALHAARKLAREVDSVAINANRNLAAYEAFGLPIWADTVPDHPGPLAGFLGGLAHCTTPWLVTVPCDSPLFPSDLVSRLATALDAEGGQLAMASARDTDGTLRPQPVFCLMHADLQASLARFIADGGRKVGAWARSQACVMVAFDRPGDDPLAFANVNTPEELRAMELAAGLRSDAPAA